MICEELFAVKGTSFSLNALLSAVSVAATGMTTFCVSLGVQLAGGSEGLGAYALITGPYVMVLAVQRMILSQNVMRGAALREVPRLTRTLIVLHVGALLTSVALVLILGGMPWMWVAACAVPLGLSQDFYRSHLFGQHAPAGAMLSDLVWLGVATLGVVISVVSPIINPLLTAVGGSLVGCVLALVIAAVVSQSRGPRMVENLNLVRLAPLVCECLLVFGMAQIAQYVCALVVDVAEVGEYRSAALLLTPLTFVASFAQSLYYPRIDISDRSQVARLSGGLAAVSIVIGLITMVLAWVDPWRVFSSLGFVATGSFMLTVLFLVIGLSLGAGLGALLLRVRVYWRSVLWLRIRSVGAILDPLVAVPVSMLVGAPGIALGPLANNLGVCSQILVFRYVSRRLYLHLQDDSVDL